MSAVKAAEGWHSVGHAQWWDPLWELEDADGAPFRKAVRSEDTHWSDHVRSLSGTVRRWRTTMRRFQDAGYPETREFAPIVLQWNGRTVHLQPGSAGYTTNVWIGGNHSKSDKTWSKFALSGIGFASSNSGWFYTLEDVGKGAEDLKLDVWHWDPSNSLPRRVWSRPHVGPSVAIQGDRIFFSTVENLLRYPDVWSANLTTGSNARRIFHEPDKRVQITLLERSGHLFVHAANGLIQRLGVLVVDKEKWITDWIGSTLIPILPTMYVRNDRIVDLKHGKEVPLPADHFIEDVRHGLNSDLFVVTVSDGCDHLWLLNDQWNLLLGDKKEVGHIEIVHEPTENPTFLVHRASKPMSVWCFEDNALRCRKTYPEPLKLRVLAHETAGVPYTVVCSATASTAAPKKLLVEAYGAYGISSRRAYPLRWLAWIKQGYAFAYVCPRGGREKGDAWYNGARTALRKQATFDDTASAIAAIQKRLRISPSGTVFFGRSAGGWLAAAMAQQHGSALVAAVYAEVPYVDVLNTTSNPSLPLTQLEYDEFGDPRRPDEYEALRRISPVDTVPSYHTPTPTLVIRTAIHDKQVLPYEALKWAAHLRMAGWPSVYVGIDHDGGHFAAAKTMIQQRAEDAAILDSAVATQNRRMDKTRRKRSTKRSAESAGISGRSRTRRR